MAALWPGTLKFCRNAPIGNKSACGVLERGAMFTTVIAALLDRVTRCAKPDEGATATEYAILMAFIAAVIIVGITVFGGQLNGWFTTMAGALPR